MDEKNIKTASFKDDYIILRESEDSEITFVPKSRFNLQVGDEFINYGGQTWFRKW